MSYLVYLLYRGKRGAEVVQGRHSLDLFFKKNILEVREVSHFCLIVLGCLCQ